MGLNYENDTPHSLYNELVMVENEIEGIGRNIKILGKTSETAIAKYELAKNQSLILMFAEEAGDPEKNIKPFKRTEAQREALYRTEHAILRFERGAAAADLKSESELLKAMLGKLNAMQSRKGLLIAERERFAGSGA